MSSKCEGLGTFSMANFQGMCGRCLCFLRRFLLLYSTDTVLLAKDNTELQKALDSGYCKLIGSMNKKK